MESLKGKRVNTQQWASPSSPFCEQINRNFCTLMVSNSDYWPRLAIGITAMMLHVTIIALCFRYHGVKLTRELVHTHKRFYNCKPLCCLGRFVKRDGQLEAH